MTATLGERLFTRGVAAMLVRNTLVSCSTFAVGLLTLWTLVKFGDVNKVVATAISFIVANSLHYAAGRWWIFQGTQRPLASGYFYFLVNGGIGLIITVAMFDALTRFTTIDYLVARALVSIVAGLAMFALNGLFNFRRI